MLPQGNLYQPVENAPQRLVRWVNYFGLLNYLVFNDCVIETNNIGPRGVSALATIQKVDYRITNFRSKGGKIIT